MPVCRLLLTSASTDQYPDATLTAKMDPSCFCALVFLRFPHLSIGGLLLARFPNCLAKADWHPWVFLATWLMRTRVMAFTPLLCQGGPVAWRFPQSFAKEDLYRDVRTTDKPRQSRRTRRSRRTTVADANERVAAVGPPWRTRMNALRPSGRRGGRERTRRSRRDTVAEANERFAAVGPPWRTRTNALRPSGRRGGRERTCRSRPATVAEANERAAAAGAHSSLWVVWMSWSGIILLRIMHSLKTVNNVSPIGCETASGASSSH
ncbi:hypothetical protein Y032_0113g344 [Ancylostoma ceylanicum]|uniref:Uncharacterized protein n=1 Tax=Ancylostoma ceylanicum TaxID=53326 RepID=A0A016TDF6_9BILA|nr:hypothetical protein Y032_0113g344 [Ancylostoma ceylanicum]